GLDQTVKAPSALATPQQARPEGDVLARTMQDRLAHRAPRGLHLVEARTGGHPAGLEVQLRDPPVIAIEDREEVLREVILVARIERAEDAEVDRRVARPQRLASAQADIAGTHAGQ